MRNKRNTKQCRCNNEILCGVGLKLAHWWCNYGGDLKLGVSKKAIMCVVSASLRGLWWVNKRRKRWARINKMPLFCRQYIQLWTNKHINAGPLGCDRLLACCCKSMWLVPRASQWNAQRAQHWRWRHLCPKHSWARHLWDIIGVPIEINSTVFVQSRSRLMGFLLFKQIICWCWMN